MKFEKSVKLKCDNQATISIAKDPIHHDITCDNSCPRTRPNPKAEPDPGRSPLFESNSFFFCQ